MDKRVRGSEESVIVPEITEFLSRRAGTVLWINGGNALEAKVWCFHELQQEIKMLSSLFRLLHHHNQRAWYKASGHNSFRTKEINFWYPCIGSGLGNSWWETWVSLNRSKLTPLMIYYLVKTISLLGTIKSHYLNVSLIQTMGYFIVIKSGMACLCSNM